jgi:ribosomal protein S18 acetylase RimI-like enzyme
MRRYKPLTRLKVGEPRTFAQLDEYYRLRWRVLREPLGYPRGAERDDLDHAAFHVTVRDRDDRLLGIGRLHFNDAGEAQIRFMATDPRRRRRGVGRAVIARLEEIAAKNGKTRIVLNARLEAVGFYERLGYRVTGRGPTFGQVEHQCMEKHIDSQVAAQERG